MLVSCFCLRGVFPWVILNVGGAMKVEWEHRAALTSTGPAGTAAMQYIWLMSSFYCHTTCHGGSYPGSGLTFQQRFGSAFQTCFFFSSLTKLYCLLRVCAQMTLLKQAI